MTSAIPQTHKIWLAASIALLVGSVSLSYGESLFRANANYTANAPMNPRSLYTQPRPQNVGDIITVLVEEESIQQATSNMKIDRSQTIQDNGTGIFNNFVRFIAGKVPGVDGTKIKDVAFSFNDVDNANTLESKAETTRNVKYTDSVTCQVVQVLPNGYLVVQGKKSVLMSKERQELYLSGIVNPFYLDRNNQIQSKQLGNFQFAMSGKGVISRQQNDGMANKLYQFFQ